VDDAMLEAGKKGCSHGSGGVLFLGSWIDRKGIWDLVPAVTSILREKPGAFFTAAGCQVEEAFVLGEFPADVRSRVRVIPRLSNSAELDAVYRGHSVFLLPSYFEGQPLVMMEAAAYGLAIVTTPVCGMLDFIQHGSNGLFVQLGNSSSIQAALLRLIDNPQEAQALGAAARRKVESHTWRASALNLAGVYKRLVGR
jgi:glycosyltransferase involved in cell wall biosynthesis